MAFSEQGNEISVVFTGDAGLKTILNPCVESDGLSLSIISGLTSSLHEDIKEGKIVLMAVMKTA